MKSSAIKKVESIKGRYNTRITFTDNSVADYNLTKEQINKLNSDHPGRYYNKNIRRG